MLEAKVLRADTFTEEDNTRFVQRLWVYPNMDGIVWVGSRPVFW